MRGAIRSNRFVRDRDIREVVDPGRLIERSTHRAVRCCGHRDVIALGRCRAHLSVQNAAQIVGRIESRIAGYLMVRTLLHAGRHAVQGVDERRT